MSKRPRSKATEELESNSDLSEEEEEEEEEVQEKSKKKKKKTTTASAPSTAGEKQEDGSYVFPLANKRNVTVRDFKGKLYVDIREFYEDKQGDLKPGKKGISLQLEQWQKLKDMMDDIDEAISTF